MSMEAKMAKTLIPQSIAAFLGNLALQASASPLTTLDSTVGRG